MGFLNTIQNFITRKPVKEPKSKVQVYQNAGRHKFTTTGKVSYYNYDELTSYYFTPLLGQPRNVNVNIIRELSKTPSAAMCINLICKVVRNAKWSLVPFDDDEEISDTETFRRVKDFFDYPNTQGLSIDVINEMVTRDYLEMGEGAVNKIFTQKVSSKKSFILNENKWRKRFVNTDNINKDIGYYVPVLTGFKDFKKEISYPDKEVIKKIIKKNLLVKEKDDITKTLLEIRPIDTASFLKNPDVYNLYDFDEPAYFQYNWRRPKGYPIPFFKREMAWAVNNPNTYGIYGHSPILNLLLVLETINAGLRSNKLLFENGAIPDSIITLATANPDEIEKLTNFFKNRFKNNPHKTFITGYEHNINLLNMSNKDMEYLAGMQFYQRLVMAMFNVTSDELGFVESSNRATGQGQSRVFVREAVKPILRMLEDLHNNYIIPEFYNDKPECKFKYEYDDEFEKEMERNNDEKDVKLGAMTLNEFRRKRGLDDLSWGDDDPREGKAFSGGYTPNMNDEPKKDDKKKDENSENKKGKGFKKNLLTREYLESLSITELKRVINEGSGTDKSLAEEIFKEYVNRSKELKTEEPEGINTYLDKVFNHMIKDANSVIRSNSSQILSGNTADSIGKLSTIIGLLLISKEKGLKKYVKENVVIGVENAESLTNQNYLHDVNVESLSKQFTNQVITGYTLPDGKVWNGLQGVTNDLQVAIVDKMNLAVAEGKSINWLTKEISEVSGLSKVRAKAISRTEMNRILSNTTFKTLKDNGYNGFKKWISSMDDNTCSICKRMNGQVVPFNEPFFDEKTGIKYMIGPIHTNCRCSFVVENVEGE